MPVPNEGTTALPSDSGSRFFMGAWDAVAGVFKALRGDEVNGLKVDVARLPLGAAFTNRSGTIAAGGTAQQLAAANASRRYLLIQNQSTAPLYVDIGATAVVGQPSVTLSACTVANDGTGGSLELGPGVVPPGSVSIIGGTTGQAYTAKET